MADLKFDRKQSKVRNLEDDLTPVEIAELLARGSQEELNFGILPLLSNGQAPTGYMRSSWCENAHFYTANKGARKLLITFAGRAARLGVPTSYFLQMLRDDSYDVVMLTDPFHLHFDRGVPDFSDSLLATTRRLGDFVAKGNFDEVICFGVSMGGCVALRAGILLQANRAISVGGRYCWHIGRLSRGAEVKPFDVLCACYSQSQVQMTAVVASKNPEDVGHLEVTLRTFPACRTVMVDTSTHNVMGHFYRLGLLRLLLASLLEHSDQQVEDKHLSSLLNQIALQVDGLEASRKKRIGELSERLAQARNQANELKQKSAIHLEKLRSEVQHVRQESRDKLRTVQEKLHLAQKKIKAVHASRSWRLTWALRALAGLFRR